MGKSYQTKLVCTQCTKCVLCTIKDIKQWDIMNACPVCLIFSLGISSSSEAKRKAGVVKCYWMLRLCGGIPSS